MDVFILGYMIEAIFTIAVILGLNKFNKKICFAVCCIFWGFILYMAYWDDSSSSGFLDLTKGFTGSLSFVCFLFLPIVVGTTLYIIYFVIDIIYKIYNYIKNKKERGK